MNQTQFQQEPKTMLPRIAPSPSIVEATSEIAPPEAGEEVSVQSAVVEKLLAVMEQNTRKRQKWNSLTSLACSIIALIYLFRW